MSPRSTWTVLALVAALAALALVPSAASAVAEDTSVDRAVSTALAYAQANPDALDAIGADVTDLAVTSAYTSKHNGVTHVNLNQRYAGLEVFGAHATVNVTAAGRVAFVGGGFEANLAAASSAVDLDAAEAVEAAADALDLAEPENLRVLS
ncbi:MAG TPA: hypothetical protein VFO88_04345, partial [Gaiellaceae bacterium]|nr:hypothetical protein [Gaiellaceae bacterium]